MHKQRCQRIEDTPSLTTGFEYCLGTEVTVGLLGMKSLSIFNNFLFLRLCGKLREIARNALFAIVSPDRQYCRGIRATRPNT
jgi:hypothetical protein